MSTKKELPALTGLRGIAAVWVVLFHLYPTMSEYIGIRGIGYFPMIGAGFMGVDLFFILSGFIMCYVHARDFQKYCFHEHTHFLKLRLSRIYPLHVFILVLLLAVTIVLPGFTESYSSDRFSYDKFFYSLFLVQNWGFGFPNSWNIPAWSLSAEWLAYLAFPLIITVIYSLPRNLEIFVAAALLVGMIAITYLFRDGVLDATGRFGIFRMVVGFTVGCLIYKNSEKSDSLPPTFILPIAITIIFAAIIDSRFYVLALPGLALLIRSLINPKKVALIIFANPVVMWLGKISFSLYLVHWVALQVFQWIMTHTGISSINGNRYVALAGFVVLIFSLATLLWKYFELPCQRYIRRKYLTQINPPKIMQS